VGDVLVVVGESWLSDSAGRFSMSTVVCVCVCVCIGTCAYGIYT
jgi:hypothetical protein